MGMDGRVVGEWVSEGERGAWAGVCLVATESGRRGGGTARGDCHQRGRRLPDQTACQQ